MPHAARDDVHARDRRPDNPLGRRDVDEPGHHHGDDAGDVAHIGHQVDEEGNEHFEEHVEVRVLHADGAGALDDPIAEQPQQNTEQQAADEFHEEVDPGVNQGERSGDRGGNGALEGHDTRGVVQEQLALQHGGLALRDVHLLRKRRDRHGVGGAQGRAQGEGRRQRNGGHERVQQEADDERRGHHQAYGQGEHGLALAPERLLVGVLRLVVEQRRDEHDEEQLRVERHLHLAAGHNGNEEPDDDLDERKRDARDDLVDERGRQDGDEQEQTEGQRFHKCISFWVSAMGE